MSFREELAQNFRDAQSQLVVQTADLPLGTLAGMVDSGAIDLQPGFQRRERWSAEKQSALIESFLLNVPVPPVYLAEEADGTYTAIDGKQRLKAIADFIGGRLYLRNLDRLTSADRIRFDDLPPEIKNALRLRPFLRVVTLLKQTDPLLKYEVFLRLNRGGEALNAQEIRNVAFRGALNDEIYRLSENAFLRSRLKIENERSAAYRDMADAEFVLRFMTLRDRFDEFGGSLTKEMDEFMRSRQNSRPDEVARLTGDFEAAVDRCSGIWGNVSFRRPEGAGWRDQTLAGMYDAQMLAVVRVSGAVIERAQQNTNEIIERTRRLFENPEFDKSVRTGTNTPQRIRYRVDQMQGLLEGI